MNGEFWEMIQDYTVDACAGKAISVYRAEMITLVDLEGGQVLDFLRRHPETPVNSCRRV